MDRMENNELQTDGPEMERYGTAWRWSVEFNLARQTIEKRLNHIRGLLGKATSGNLNIYYSESEVRKACADILRSLPEADEEGFFTDMEGKRYGTTNAWAKEFDLVGTTVATFLKDAESIPGRNAAGNTVCFYEEKLVRTAVERLLLECPTANKEGFFEVAGKKFGTVRAWAKVLGISAGTIRKYLGDNKGITGKHHAGKILENLFYEEETLRSACNHLIKDIPKADKKGFVTLGEIRYGSIGAWEKETSLGRNILGTLFADIPAITARDSMGRIVEGTFYPETALKTHLEERKTIFVSDEEGAVKVTENDQEIRYKTISAWALELDVTNRVLKNALKGKSFVKGIDAAGCIRLFYSEQIVRDYIREMDDLPVADANGYIMIKGENDTVIPYAMLYAWRKKLGKSFKALRKIRDESRMIKGKDGTGKIRGFYPEPEIRNPDCGLISPEPQNGK